MGTTSITAADLRALGEAYLELGRATDARTRCYYAETLPNPKLKVFPIAEVAKIGRELGLQVPFVLYLLLAVLVGTAMAWLLGEPAPRVIDVPWGFTWPAPSERSVWTVRSRAIVRRVCAIWL